jgi:hypothetical protein
MLESNHATLAKVYPRWISLNSHFYNICQPANSSPWANDISTYLAQKESGWGERMDKQLIAIYIVAFILTPINYTHRLTPVYQQMVQEYIKVHAGVEALEQYFNYVDKEGYFNNQAICWKFSFIKK